MDEVTKYLPSTSKSAHIWPASALVFGVCDAEQFKLYFIQIEYKSMCKVPAANGK